MIGRKITPILVPLTGVPNVACRMSPVPIFCNIHVDCKIV